MKLLLSLLLLLISPGILAAPLPDIFSPPAVPALSLPALLPQPLPPAHPSGDLARDRLEGMTQVFLSSDKVAVAQIGQPASPLSSERAKVVLAALSGLVLDDSLYVADAQYEMQDKSSRAILIVGNAPHCITVSLWRDKPLLTIMRDDGNRWVAANDLLVLPKVVKLLRAVDPNDPGLNRTLVTAPSAPSTEGVPASVLTRIATLKPGMTRADVLRLFTTEGGVFTAYWNHYVYRSAVSSKPGQHDGMFGVPGGLVKVNIDFAPPDADIDWVDGKGFWLGQNKYSASHNQFGLSGNPDDIVLKVSPPYVQQMILD